MSNTAPRVGPDALESFWMSGTTQEPELELVDGQLRLIQREETPPAPRQRQRSRSNIALRLSELTWD